jgi:hypothetical protein
MNLRTSITAVGCALALASSSLLVGAAPASAAPDRARDCTTIDGKFSLSRHARDIVPTTIDAGAWPAGHVQGIAIDEKRGHIYYSFTTMLVKTDLHGNVLGSVVGFTGHLGDLDFNERDSRVYGSLEYKSAESFYIAIIDVRRIDRMNMDAESGGIVTTVYLEEVVEDFTADMDGNGVFDGDIAATPDHRYGSSGIDGVAFGPQFGDDDGRDMLMVAYGVYSNLQRADNDNQVILQYDVRKWRRYEQPLSQSAPHRSGPAEEDTKYFVYTGNTTWGVQNLEYDRASGDWMLGVYAGQKPEFPNYTLFVVDGSAQPVLATVAGQATEEQGLHLPLLEQGMHHAPSDTWGFNFIADVGIESLGCGYFYVAEQGRVTVDGQELQTAVLHLYRWTGDEPAPFERVTY